MAGNPFAVGPEDDPTANLPNPETFNRLRGQWSTFLENPRAQAFLMNAGIALAQPPSFGDTGHSQFARALGSGAEAVGRQEAMDIKEMEAESKAQAREAAANLAGARAWGVGQQAVAQSERAGRERERLDLQRARQGDQLSMARVMAANKLHGEYNNVVADIDKANRDVLRKGPPTPIPSFNDWLGADPARRMIAEQTGILAPSAAPAAPAAPTSQAPVALPSKIPDAQRAAAEKWLKDNPNDPDAPRIRQLLGK